MGQAMIHYVEVTDEAILGLVENYCREAGVRNLQKHIEKIYRKIALQLERQGVPDESSPVVEDKGMDGESKAKTQTEVEEKAQIEFGPEDITSKQEKDSKTNTELEQTHADQIPSEGDQVLLLQKNPEANKVQEPEARETAEKIIISESNLSEYVGKPVFHADRIYQKTPVGVVMGLAWTCMGGSALYIETTQVEQGEGKGGLHLTGQLGDVMKESAEIAQTVSRAILLEKEQDALYFTNTKIHLHVPAGASPKDGPSAGCSMITSMLSLAMKKPVRKDLAMTGEVTLTGKILPIGGVKEKTIAAKRCGVKTIIFPSANRRDFDELEANLTEGLDVHFVDDYMQIFDIAFSDDQDTEK